MRLWKRTENTSRSKLQKPSKKSFTFFSSFKGRVPCCARIPPNIITNYLYELAKLFNTFYHEVGPPGRVRVTSCLPPKLTEATKAMLKEGLELIGIEVPEEMKPTILKHAALC
jgi:hypothetical protein